MEWLKLRIAELENQNCQETAPEIATPTEKRVPAVTLSPRRQLFAFDIIMGMSVRLVIESLRMIAHAIMQPGSNLDLYFNDRYVVVSKRIVVAAILAVILIPVLLITALSFGSMHP